MKTLFVLPLATVLLFLATSRGEEHEKFKDFEDESQDYVADRVKEWRQRQQLRSMFDPNCLVWTRRNSNCFNGKKRSYDSRQARSDSTDNSVLQDADYYE